MKRSKMQTEERDTLESTWTEAEKFWMGMGMLKLRDKNLWGARGRLLVNALPKVMSLAQWEDMTSRVDRGLNRLRQSYPDWIVEDVNFLDYIVGGQAYERRMWESPIEASLAEVYMMSYVLGYLESHLDGWQVSMLVKLLGEF